ncbi:MAG: hypothetical protein JWM71_605 [Solirubrobacteraceae bacterium]|nr:hypothetical protein [Solirubrobacteraceae bacterium]
MRRLLALLTVCVAMPAASAAAAPQCTLPGAKTVIADAQARVFSVPGKGDTTLRYFGCLTGHRPYLLAADITPKSSDDTRTATTLFRLAGPWVAWHSTSSSDFGVGEFAESVEVRSLAGAKRSLSVPVTSEPLTALAVLPDGTVGWVLSIGDYREIDAVAHTTTTPTPIAYTRGIDSKSVQFATDHVTWTQNGSARSAALTAPAPPPGGTALGAQALDGRFGDCGTLVPAQPSSPASSEATQLATEPDGDIIAAGTTTSGQGDPVIQDSFVIARFTAGGVFDPAFGRGGVVTILVPRPKDAQDAELTDAVVQPDGKILIAGFVRLNDPDNSSVILYRLNPDGSPDASFGTGGVVQDAVPAKSSADVHAMLLTATGAILIAGQRDKLFYVARYTPGGTLDPTFGTNGMAVDPGKDISIAESLAVEPDGTIFAGGQAASEPMLIRFNPDGVAQSGNYQSPPAASAITALTARPGGGVIAVGAASNVVAKGQLFLARYTATGAPDTTFGAGGFVLDPQVTQPRSIAVDPDGRLLVTASFLLHPGDYAGSGLVRYAADGARDTSFGLRGALGGVSSFGLTNGDVLLDPSSGTAFVAQGNGGHFGVSRFALGTPATGAVGREPAVCAMATGTKLGPVRKTRKLGVSLRLRAPGRVRLTATIAAKGRVLTVGQVTVFRPFIEGAVATIPVSATALKLLRGAKSARLTVIAGAPGGATRRYAVSLTS